MVNPNNHHQYAWTASNPYPPMGLQHQELLTSPQHQDHEQHQYSYQHHDQFCDQHQHEHLESHEERIKYQLLEHSSVQKEMELVTEKRIRLQLTDPVAGPCLYVILPAITPSLQRRLHQLPQGQDGAQTDDLDDLDFKLHFLCDFTDYEHICVDGNESGRVEPMDIDANSEKEGQPPQQPSYAFAIPRLHVGDPYQGYALQDLEDFCYVHRICLLSLLRTLQLQELSLTPMHDVRGSQGGHQDHGQDHDRLRDEAMDIDDSGFAIPADMMALRIKLAVRYLLRYFIISDLECILQAPSDEVVMDMQDYEGAFVPSLQLEDFVEEEEARIMACMTADGRVLGPLTQRSVCTAAATGDMASTPAMRTEMIQWLCSHHTQRLINDTSFSVSAAPSSSSPASALTRFVDQDMARSVAHRGQASFVELVLR
ncbi:hypothetical protein BG011_003552 [Mortierella polycephala]|uniref:Uncharacterized protein n=1 Tax=Mortierella polycephala TaxID=41804 RepID=A0A9P6Q3B9_9FUNG|nr:hypothetical protein BG011_003552 [Mortierella polycephala]